MAVTTEVELPSEAPDMTTSELHEHLLSRLAAAVEYALAGKALVLKDIFVRLEGKEQKAPDLLVAPYAPPGARKVYAVPDEPVPLVTVEVISEDNYSGPGKKLLEEKRAFFGRMGVPLHIEVDPNRAAITTWANRSGVLERTGIGTTYDGPQLGGVRIEARQPGEVHVYLPDGREVLNPGAELARWYAEAARAEAEAERAAKLAERAAQLAERLRQLGIDPDQD